MEFFAKIDNPGIDAMTLFDRLTIDILPDYTPSINKVLTINSHASGEVYTVWGQFNISREQIKNGVRFALLNCPHAFAWTIAVHAQTNMLTVHCTIDKETEDEDFVESIQQFVTELADSLTTRLVTSA